MYKISIKGLTFKAIVGLLDFERVTPQRIVVDCEIEYEDKKNFIDYAEVAKDIESIMKEEKFFLLEDALDSIIERLSLKYRVVKSINLSISKPEILQNCAVCVTKLKKF